MLQNSKSTNLKELRQIMVDIQHDNHRASESVGRMRTLLRRQRLELEPLDLNELVQEVLQMTSGEIARRYVHVATEHSPELPRVKGDRVHLQQVLLNLVLNGMDAMEDTPPSERRLRIRIGNSVGRVVVAINDTGHGIPRERLPRIFESFYTTKKGGMGLGLSIAKSIIEAHLGRIWAENDAKGGATFRFTLPVEARDE